MGLVGWWKLDGNAKDFGPYGNHGSGSVSYSQGKIGQAFNCNSGTLNIGNSEEIKNTFKGKELTISFWWKQNSVSSGWQDVINKGSHRIERYKERDPGSYWAGLYEPDGTQHNFSQIISTVGVGEWFHFVLRKDMDEMAVWINGDKHHSINGNWLIGSYEANSLELGRHTIDDQIDDVKIYDNAISDGEIKELSKAKVLHYKFDNFQEPTENLINDPDFDTASAWDDGSVTLHSSGGVDGGSYVSSTSTWGFGQNISITDTSTDYQISGYVKNTESDNKVRVTGTGDYEINYSIDTGGTWTYFEHDVDMSSDTDGTFRLNILDPNKAGARVAADKFQLEKKNHSTPFINGTRSGIIRDVSGYNNDAILTLDTAPTWREESIIGIGCYDFDGETQYIDCGSNSNLNLTDNLTISCWGYARSNGWSRLVMRSVHNQWQIDFSGAGEYRFIVYDSSASNDLRVYSDESNLLNEWYHIVGTYGPDGIHIYINGVEQQDSASRFGTLNSVPNAPLNIGRDCRDRSYFDGLIDDVRIYNRVLTAEEIDTLYKKRASLDNIGNFQVQSLEEPKEILLIDSHTKNVYDNSYKSMSTWNQIETDLSPFVEGDNTLGNTIVEGWVYVSDTTYVLNTIEFTKENNTKGFKKSVPSPDTGWMEGWNYINFPVSSYNSKDSTPWGDMDRLEFYRTGPTTGVDTNQYITIKNLKLRKLKDNSEIQNVLTENGTMCSLELTEAARPFTDPIADHFNDWELGTTGSQGSFSRNGATNENRIIYYPDPWDNFVPTWECMPESDDGSDGGWNMNFTGDNSERLRMSVFVKRINSMNGSTYLGCHSSGNTQNLSGSENGNPYFWSGNLPNLDEWFLLVGILHPNSYSGSDSGLSGVYDLSGTKRSSGNDYKWGTGNSQRQRAYLYYCTNPDERQYFVYPRVDVVDGSEPSIRELLQGIDSHEYHINSRASQFKNSFNVRGQLSEV